METPILSIVVPTYNCAEFLPRCLDSLINQSLKNIKIIVVDDASTDMTKNILEFYIQAHCQIEVISNANNKGTGLSRNIGLSYVNTRYTAFLDADDWIDTNAYQDMTQSLEKSHAEIAVCGICTEYSDSRLSQIRYQYPHQNLISGDFSVKLLSHLEQQDIFISPMVGNKVFRTSFLRQNQISFPCRTFAEDDEFSFLTFCMASTVQIVPNVYQHYFQRENSAMHSFSFQVIDQFIEMLRNLKSNLIEHSLFDRHINNYFAFFDKCLSTMLDTLFSCEPNINNQRKYLVYLIDEILKEFSVQELMEHCDPHRLQRLWLR